MPKIKAELLHFIQLQIFECSKQIHYMFVIDRHFAAVHEVDQCFYCFATQTIHLNFLSFIQTEQSFEEAGAARKDQEIGCNGFSACFN